MTFTVHEDVAVVEHDDAGKPAELGAVHYGTVTEARMCSVTARFGDGDEQLFLLDSRDRAWRESGRWRLVHLCRCDDPILGEPVTGTDGILYCSGDCRDADDEAAQEAYYPSGVAT